LMWRRSINTSHRINSGTGRDLLSAPGDVVHPSTIGHQEQMPTEVGARGYSTRLPTGAVGAQLLPLRGTSHPISITENAHHGLQFSCPLKNKCPLIREIYRFAIN
jgi:hypothetical protein